MSEPLFYREIQFSRLAEALPEKAGSFVVGIPTKTVGDKRFFTDEIAISIPSKP